MISAEDAVRILRGSYTKTNTSIGTQYVSNYDIMLSNRERIADLIEHLSGKCDLEVNELMED